MKRFEVGRTCLDSNGMRVFIWDNEEERNYTWCHKDRVHAEVRRLNENERYKRG